MKGMPGGIVRILFDWVAYWWPFGRQVARPSVLLRSAKRTGSSSAKPPPVIAAPSSTRSSKPVADTESIHSCISAMSSPDFHQWPTGRLRRSPPQPGPSRAKKEASKLHRSHSQLGYDNLDPNAHRVTARQSAPRRTFTHQRLHRLYLLRA